MSEKLLSVLFFCCCSLDFFLSWSFLLNLNRFFLLLEKTHFFSFTFTLTLLFFLSFTCSTGMKYCECDIALTLDEHLVLCHDVNFKRLALFDDGQSSRDIGELTYRELIALPLKSGACVIRCIF